MVGISPDSVLGQLRWRYAVQKFDPTRKIPAPIWEALEQALLLAPSSYGLQPWKFVVVTSDETKRRLPAISWEQPQPRDCSHLVVFAARREILPRDVDRHIARIAAVRGVLAESLEDFRAGMLGTIARMSRGELRAWIDRQVSIAMGFFLNAAALLGIDTCPMEGINRGAYDAQLGLDAEYATLAAVAAGYRAADDPFAGLAKVRFEPGEVIAHID